MSAAADLMAVIMFVFFLVGVAVGIVIVIAVSARRAHKAHRQHRRAALSRRTWPYRDQVRTD